VSLPYEFQLARRNLTRHPWHTAAMVTGLALAVLVMVYIPSNLASFYDDILDRAVEQNSAHVTIWPLERPVGTMDSALRRKLGGPAVLAFDDRTYPRHHDLNGRHALAAQTEAVEGVQAVASVVRGNATASRGRVNLGITIEGVDFRQYARVVNIAQHFPEGRVPKMGPNDIAIGFRMARKLGIHVGEHVHVATARTRRLMRVKAVYHCGYYEKDMRHAYVTLRTAQSMFATGSEVSALAVRCDQIDQVAAVSETLRERLGKKVRNWMDDNASLLAEISTINRVAMFIDVLVALVASVGMANLFSMFVLSRQKELAILRAVGASRLSLRGILLLEAGFVWVVGTIVGYTGAMGIMAYEQAHPFEVSAESHGIASFATHPTAEAMLLAAGLAGATMLGSAIWSGRRAARLNPVEVIFGH